MSKNRDLIYDMAEAPETEDFEQLDSEPLQPSPVMMPACWIVSSG